MMNVTFDKLSAMDFEQRSSKPELQGMTSRRINLGLDLAYAPSKITSQNPTEHELDLLFEAMYDDYIGGQLSDATRTDVDELPQQQHVQQQDDQAQLQYETVADNVNDVLFDDNTFKNPFAPPSTSAAETSTSDRRTLTTSFDKESATDRWGNVQLRFVREAMKPSNVKESMTNPGWIDLMQEELFQFERLDVWELVSLLDKIKPLTLKWLFKNKLAE
ncbi:hypothetical protein Tco_0443022 [Tanacetum coccineum]